MTNLLTYPFETIARKSILDEETAKKRKINLALVKYVSPVREEDKFIVTLSEGIDNFEYPSLYELRKQFEKTGIYSKARIDEIVKAYERLPKYRTQSNRPSGSKKRS